MPRARTRSTTALPALDLRVKLWFEVDGRFAIGEGGFELLRAINDNGSLVGAAETVGWSYRHAWGYLRRAETILARPLTTRRAGKGAKRGLDLTDAARELLQRAAKATKANQRLRRHT